MKSIPFGRPELGDPEKQAVWQVMDSGLLVHGPKIAEFEAEFAAFTGAPFAVGVASCTAALNLTYFVHGLGPGDEVIVPALTHTATAHAVELVGATPVFVDAEEETGNIDLNLVEAAISDRTRAISVVHFLGMPVDMRRVNDIAERHRLFVVEDCALAVGAALDGTHVGLFGTTGCFSFYPVKHMTTAEGGMIITRDEKLASMLAHQRAFGVDRHQTERTIPGVYDVTALGYNYRMSEIHAAIGTEQMKRLPGMLESRRQNYAQMTEGLEDLSGIELLATSHEGFASSYYCHCIVLSPELGPRRAEIIEDLKRRGVGTSVYYPRPVPLMSYYRGRYGFQDGQFPMASRVSDRSIALPVGPHMGSDDVQYVVEQVREVVENSARA